jgi:uncharacterized membrane protein YhaH (DUF805 family)
MTTDEPGDEFMRRFFSFDARIGRLRLLAGIIIGLAIGWVGVLVLREVGGLAAVVVGGVAGATIGKLVVEAGRRRNDMGTSVAMPLVALAAAVFAIGLTAMYELVTGNPVPNYLALTIFVLVWAVLLLRPGEAVANGCGLPPDTLTPSFGKSPVGRAGLILSVILTLSGAALGVGANLWFAGLARQNERGQAIAEGRDGMDAAPDNLESQYQEQSR